MIADPAPIDDSVPAPPANIDWPLLERVPSLLAAGNCSADTCRQLLIQSQQELQQRFRDDEPVEALVRARAAFIDRLLAQLWGAQLNDDLAGRATLAAVGGYGRRELHPCSDVDLMVLTPESLTDADREPIEKLVAFLWDIGLEVGHSVRTVSECAEESIADVGVMTTLLEARALAGSASLLPAMRTALAPDRVWPVRRVACVRALRCFFSVLPSFSRIRTTVSFCFLRRVFFFARRGGFCRPMVFPSRHQLARFLRPR